jgi:hypothetical protein
MQNRKQYMSLKTSPVVAFLLVACQSTQSSDPSSLEFEIPKGSLLTLNRALEIPAGETHALIQEGRLIKKGDRDDYRINCRFDVKKFGPRTIAPEKFIIRRTEDGQEWISRAGIMRYYTYLYLQSGKDTDVIRLSCQQYGDNTQRNFSVSEIGHALGGYFSFSFTDPQTTP